MTQRQRVIKEIWRILTREMERERGTGKADIHPRGKNTRQKHKIKNKNTKVYKKTQDENKYIKGTKNTR